MAEYVNESLENMIPELEEMIHEGLFTSAETKIILKNREKLEYKTRQVTKTKSSFLNYISYEKKLLELLMIRKKSVGKSAQVKSLKKSIINRIHKLYRVLTTRFSEDASLFKEHIEFSKKNYETGYVSRLYEQLLKLHSHKEEFWIEAAMFESSKEGSGNPAIARELLLKGHRVLPESENIILQMFRMELQLAKKLAKRREILGIEETDEGNSSQTGSNSDFKLSKIVYKKGLEVFPDNCEFHTKMLHVCTSVKEAKSLRKEILNDLRQTYPDNALMWNALALSRISNLKKLSEAHKCTKIQKCVDILKEAVAKLQTKEMYGYSLRTLLNLLSLKSVKKYDKLMQATLFVFEQALGLSLLPESLYIPLIELLSGLSMYDDVDRVATLAVQHYPQSPQLWLAHFRVLISSEVADKQLVKKHKQALKTVPLEDSWVLFEILLNHLDATNSEFLQNVMEKACRTSAPSVSQPAKDWVLLWSFRTGGIKKARSAYNSLKTIKPTSINFYRLYIEMEASLLSPKLKMIRTSFEEALIEFGSSSPELWLNYIQYEMTVGEEGSKSGEIRDRALRMLDKHLRESFIRLEAMAGITH